MRMKTNEQVTKKVFEDAWMHQAAEDGSSFANAGWREVEEPLNLQPPDFLILQMAEEWQKKLSINIKEN